MMKKIFVFLLFSLITIILFAQISEFSKNKVNYKNNKWQIIKTKHFDIYFYQGGEELAKFASIVAESSMVHMENDFQHKLSHRVPIVIYNSHKDFEETNITIDIIDEFVGGFTEALKNRVVIPFEGSYADFRHVINHELTHAMQFDILYGKGGASVISSVVYDIPLWFIEGSAEYYSRIWDKETDMYLRDAIINDNVVDLKTLSYYWGGYVIYKEGQSVLKYIADTYGEERIATLYKEIKKTKSFYKALKKVLGIDIKTLDKDWKFYYKKRYFPLIVNKNNIPKNSKSLMGKFLNDSPYNISPTISPNGNYVAFISEQYGFFDIFLISTYKPEKRKKVLPRTITRHYESFHLKQGNLNWSNDSKLLLFSARSGNKERIYLYNVEKNKEYKHFDIKNADGIFSPAINNNKDRVVFTLMKNGHTDIAIYNLNNKQTKTITNDIYDDINPLFLNDSTIIFSSTRNYKESIWNYNEYKIFTININTGEITYIDGNYKSIENFSIYNDSTIIYSAYTNDISNIYTMNINNGEVKQLTNTLTGVFRPTIARNGKKIVCQFFKDQKMDIILINNPLKFQYNNDSLETYNDYVNIFYPYYTKYKIKIQKPPFNFSFDWAAGAFSYTPGFGLLGLLDVGMSDILGNNRLYIQMEKLSFNGDGYVAIQYWYLKHRWDIGLLFLNLQYEEWNTYYTSYTNLYNGGGIVFSYPFNRYLRFQLETDLYFFDRTYNEYTSDFFYVRKTPVYDNYKFTMNTIGLVRDNSIWGYYGPVNGDRERIDVGIVKDNFDDIASYNYGFLSIDMRKYFVLTKRSQFAIKIAGRSNFGDEAPNEYIGGTGTVRGYDEYSFAGKNAYYSNLELRFPLIDRIQFPMNIFDIYMIRGVLFTDLGFAKDNFSDLNIFAGERILDDLKMGIGTGIRMNIWITLLKLDIAKNTDLTTLSDETYFHVDFGAEF